MSSDVNKEAVNAVMCVRLQINASALKQLCWCECRPEICGYDYIKVKKISGLLYDNHRAYCLSWPDAVSMYSVMLFRRLTGVFFMALSEASSQVQFKGPELKTNQTHFTDLFPYKYCVLLM